MRLTLATILLTFSLSAAPVTFVSGDGIGESNSHGANVVITPHPVWATAPPAQWIGFTNSGVGGTVLPNNWGTPFASFYETFILGTGVLSGSLSVWADDTASVYVNDALVALLAPSQGGNCASQPVSCIQSLGGHYNIASFLHSGPNVLRVDVFQRDGDVSGGMYKGWASSAVPEPATALMLGLGLAVLGLTAGRRRRTL